MLEIVQAGQAGKTSLLFDMHRLRKRIFKDRMNWGVTLDAHGLEIDQFDLPETIYVLALDNNHRVIGNWRMLPTTGPTMVCNVWPEFLATIDMPADPYAWEASRFGVDSYSNDPREGLLQIQQATQELFCGVTELCLLCGITKIYAMYDERIKRILKRIDCEPHAVSASLKIDNRPAEVAAFLTNEKMLNRLRRATGINRPLVTPDLLPPLLQILRKQKVQSHSVSRGYAAGEMIHAA